MGCNDDLLHTVLTSIAIEANTILNSFSRLTEASEHHSTPAISPAGKSWSKSTEKNASWTILAVCRRRKKAPVGQRLNFHLTRHAKERKDRSSTCFSPLFELSLRQHRSSAMPRRLPHFCPYAFAMTSNMVAVPRSRHASLDPARFFLSHCTCGRYWRTKNCRSVLAVWSHRRWRQPSKYLCQWSFWSLLWYWRFWQSISYLSCVPQTSLASREIFCGSFFFASMTGHCPSPYQIVAIQRLWRRWATFSQKRCPSIGFIFPCRIAAHRRRQAFLVDPHCLRSGDVGQLTKCTQPLPRSVASSWSIYS